MSHIELTQCQRVTDGQTDRRADRRTGGFTIASTAKQATLTRCKNHIKRFLLPVT